MYGKTATPIAKETLEKILNNETAITHRPADDLEPEMEKATKEIEDLAESPEDVLSYVMFPAPAKEFMEWRREGGGPERELVAAVVAALTEKEREPAAQNTESNPEIIQGNQWRSFGRMRQMR